MRKVVQWTIWALKARTTRLMSRLVHDTTKLCCDHTVVQPSWVRFRQQVANKTTHQPLCLPGVNWLTQCYFENVTIQVINSYPLSLEKPSVVAMFNRLNLHWLSCVPSIRWKCLWHCRVFRLEDPSAGSGSCGTPLFKLCMENKEGNKLRWQPWMRLFLWCVRVLTMPSLKSACDWP